MTPGQRRKEVRTALNRSCRNFTALARRFIRLYQAKRQDPDALSATASRMAVAGGGAAGFAHVVASEVERGES